MSELVRLTLRGAVDQPIEVEGLTPDRTATLSARDIAALPVLAGSRRAALGDFFNVQGENSDRIQIEGDLRNVDGLGAGTASGELLVHGPVGRGVGAGMTGGWIDVRGDLFGTFFCSQAALPAMRAIDSALPLLVRRRA